jgi:hypothetical protein
METVQSLQMRVTRKLYIFKNLDVNNKDMLV